MGYADPPAKNLFLLFPAASAQARLHSARRQGTTVSDYRKGKTGGAFGSAAGVVTAGLRVVDRIVEPWEAALGVWLALQPASANAATVRRIKIRKGTFLDSCGATSGIVGEQERSVSRSCD